MSLGQELVAIALGYARARFAELRAAVPADADTFAQALGRAATAAQVAAHLDLAKAAFDAAGNDSGARNLVGSAAQTWPGPVTLRGIVNTCGLACFMLLVDHLLVDLGRWGVRHACR